jgi:excisionase family DNA binding protein
VIERHYTTRELAKLLSVNPETVRREAARGLLKSVRVGSERRYPESAVRAYLERLDEDAA